MVFNTKYACFYKFLDFPKIQNVLSSTKIKWIVSFSFQAHIPVISPDAPLQCNFNMNFKNVVKHSHKLYIVMTYTRTFDSVIFVHRLAGLVFMFFLSLNATMHDERWALTVHAHFFVVVFYFYFEIAFVFVLRTKNDKLCSYGYALGTLCPFRMCPLLYIVVWSGEWFVAFSLLPFIVAPLLFVLYEIYVYYSEMVECALDPTNWPSSV